MPLKEMTEEVIESARLILSFLGNEDHGQMRVKALDVAVELKALELGDKAKSEQAARPS